LGGQALGRRRRGSAACSLLSLARLARRTTAWPMAHHGRCLDLASRAVGLASVDPAWQCAAAPRLAQPFCTLELLPLLALWPRRRSHFQELRRLDRLDRDRPRAVAVVPDLRSLPGSVCGVVARRRGGHGLLALDNAGTRPANRPDRCPRRVPIFV